MVYGVGCDVWFLVYVMCVVVNVMWYVVHDAMQRINTLSPSFLKIKKSFKLRKYKLSYIFMKDHGSIF